MVPFASVCVAAAQRLSQLWVVVVVVVVVWIDFGAFSLRERERGTLYSGLVVCVCT